MSKPTPVNQVLYRSTRRTQVLGVLFAVLVLLLLPLFSYTRTGILAPTRVTAAPATTLNFQARLLSATGALVADGNYSIVFRLYNVASGGTHEWTETRTVSVKNGYFSIALADTTNGGTAFGGSINWQEEKWLTMNVNADGEMNPRIKLTAVPYAFDANKLDGIDSGGFAQLAPSATQGVNSGNTAIRLNQTGAGSLLQLQGNGVDVATISKTGALAIAQNLTVNAGGLTVTGNSTITGTLTSLTGLTSSGTITFSGLSTAGIVTNAADGALGTVATIPLANGGTNATTAQGAINNLAGLTTEGDLLFRNATNATRLPRGTNGQCLTSTAATIQWGSCGSGVTGSGTNGQISFWNGTSSQAGDASFVWENTAKELRVYDSSATNYARIYYSGGEAVFAASTGTTRVGSGSGNINLTTSNVSDNIVLSSAGNIQLNATTTANGQVTFNRNGTGTTDYSFGVTGAPVANATSSLIRIGNAIASGNATANGGTYLGLNAPASGAGSVADLVHLQLNGATRLRVTSTGATTVANTLTVSAGGIGVTGNSTITGTLTGLTALTSSGTITFSGLNTAGIVTNTAAGVLGTISTLPVGNGGTGATTFATNGVLFGNGTSAIGATAAGTTGQCLVATTGSAPTWDACDAANVSSLNTFTGAITVQGTTNQVLVNNNTGTITLSLPQDINTTSNVSFGTINTNTFTSTALTLSGANPVISAGTLNTSLTVNANGTGALNIGTNAAAKTITIGTNTTTSTTTISAGTGGLNLGNNGVANTIQVGNTTGAVAQTVNLGNNATASSTTTVNLGSTIGTSTTNIRSGSGSVNIQGATVITGNLSATNFSGSSSGTNTGDISIAGQNYLSLTGQTLTANAINLGGTHVTGTLGVANGGTGNTTYAVGDLLYASAATTLSRLAAVASGSCLISQGVGTAPIWGSCGISAEADTLQSVTNRGATTTVASSFTGGATITGLTVDTATITHDRIRIIPASTGTTRFDGSISNTDLTAARVWNLPDATGTFITTGNLSAISSTGTITSGVWQGTAVGSQYGGTGLNTSTSTGVPIINSGTWSVPASLGANLGGTGNTTYAIGDLLVGATGNTLNKLAAVASGSCLISQGVATAPVWGNCGASGVPSVNTFTGAITVQGTTNQVIVNNNTGTITLSLPQDINTTSNVSFGTINTNTFTSTALTLSGANPVISAGTANTSLTLNANGTGALNLGTNAAAKTITIGTNTTTSTTTINAGTGGLNLGNNGIANTIQVGNTTGAVAQTLNLGNNATASSTTTINLGSTIGTSTTNIRSGSGNVNIQGATVITGNLSATNFSGSSSGTNTGDITIAGQNYLSLTGQTLTANAINLGGTHVTGTLGVANGGTGATTLTANGILFGNGTGAVGATAAGTTGQCLIATTGAAPIWGACSSTSLNTFTGAITVQGTTNQVIVNNNTGTITLSTPQDINTTSAVTFGTLGVGTITSTGNITATGTINTNTFTSTALTLSGANPVISAGTANTSLTLNANGTGALNLGTNAAAKTITIGTNTTTSTTTINAGTGGLNLGNNGIANTIQVGNTTGAVAQTLNLGNNATASSTTTINLGSTIGTSTTNILAGSGGLNIATDTAAANIVNIGNATASVTAINLRPNIAGVNISGRNSQAAGSVRGININSLTAGVATEEAINVGTGWDAILSYNGSVVINGTGIVQSAAISGTYGNLTGTGALTSGSIAAGFGNINIGTSVFTGDGSGLTSLNGSNISSGTVANARLTTSVTLQGNTFNGANQLVQLNGSAQLPAISGALLTSLNASNITSGTLGVAQGGTGGGSFTANGVIFGSGTGTLGVTAAGTAGQCLVGNTSAAPTWTSCSVAGTGSAPGGAAGGDLSGNYPNPTVARINGVSLGSTTATAGNILVGSGTQWVTRALSGDGTISSTGVLTLGTGAVNSTKILDGTIANVDLASGSFANILGTGALDAGSITSNFGAINNGASGITSTGTITGAIFSTTGTFRGLAADSATTPSFTWNGDTSLGMFRGGINILGLSTAGTERLRVDEVGNVGIGGAAVTTERLRVITASSLGAYIGVTGTGNNGTATLYVNANGAGQIGLVVQGSGTTGNLARFRSSAGNDVLVMNNEGSVEFQGIVNTSTTAAGFILNSRATSTQTVQEFQVAGTARARLRADNNGNVVVNPTGGGATYLSWDTGTGGVIFGNGSVGGVARVTGGGIGTFGGIATPVSTEPLEVQGSGAGVSYYDRTNGTTDRWVTYADNYSPGVSSFNIWHGNTRRAWVTEASHIIGLAGVGTNSTQTYGSGGACWGDVSGFGQAPTTFGRCAASSARYKNTVTDLNMGLDDIRKLRPVTYYYNDGYADDQAGILQVGFIAEEVDNISPLYSIRNKDGAVENVRYEKLTTLLAIGVKELDVQTRAIDGQLDTALTQIVSNSNAITTTQQNVSTLQNQLAAGQFGNINVGGVATVNDLKVTGNTTLNTLTVTGNAEFRGQLVVEALIVKTNLMINGQILSAGNRPEIAKGANLGQDYQISQNQVLAVNVEIDGTDTAGTINMVAGQSATKGVLAKVTFAKNYDKAPRIVVTPTNEDSLALPVFIRKVEGGFEIVTNTVPEAGKTYQFDYIIIGSESVAGQ